MDNFPKPYRECCLHSDPRRVYDLTGWNPTEKLYRLRNDEGHTVFVRCNEFTPLSSCHEELIEAGPDGRLHPVSDLIEGVISLSLREEPQEGHPLPSGATLDGPRPDVPGPVPKARKSQPKATGDAAGAKERVRSMLAEASTREQIAGMAAEVLGEDSGCLISKYAHLDNGRFRMVLGNRMVGRLK